MCQIKLAASDQLRTVQADGDWLHRIRVICCAETASSLRMRQHQCSQLAGLLSRAETHVQISFKCDVCTSTGVREGRVSSDVLGHAHQHVCMPSTWQPRPHIIPMLTMNSSTLHVQGHRMLLGLIKRPASNPDGPLRSLGRRGQTVCVWPSLRNDQGVSTSYQQCLTALGSAASTTCVLCTRQVAMVQRDCCVVAASC